MECVERSPSQSIRTGSILGVSAFRFQQGPSTLNNFPVDYALITAHDPQCAGQIHAQAWRHVVQFRKRRSLQVLAAGRVEVIGCLRQLLRSVSESVVGYYGMYCLPASIRRFYASICQRSHVS